LADPEKSEKNLDSKEGLDISP